METNCACSHSELNGEDLDCCCGCQNDLAGGHLAQAQTPSVNQSTRLQTHSHLIHYSYLPWPSLFWHHIAYVSLLFPIGPIQTKHSFNWLCPPSTPVWPIMSWAMSHAHTNPHFVSSLGLLCFLHVNLTFKFIFLVFYVCCFPHRHHLKAKWIGFVGPGL